MTGAPPITMPTGWGVAMAERRGAGPELKEVVAVCDEEEEEEIGMREELIWSG